MTVSREVTRDVLALDYAQATDRIVHSLREAVFQRFRKRGAVVAVSGGIDSSAVAALAVRAFGPERVFALLLPEGESAAARESKELGLELVRSLGVAHAIEDMTETLRAIGCYRRRDEAIRQVIPEYGEGWKSKIVLPSVVDSDQYRVFSIVARAPDGREVRARMSTEAYLGVVAATNFKQRTRKMLEYYHADRLNYAVAGTPNRLEYDQGFFVKGGDGLADVKPIAHLYKTQVYALAAHLGVPENIRRRPPTTDTYSLPQSQEEFYFSLPYDQMDLCLWGRTNGVEPAVIGKALDLTEDQVKRVYRDIDGKRRVTDYLRAEPVLVEAIAAHDGK
jgi:NAD+ synthase